MGEGKSSLEDAGVGGFMMRRRRIGKTVARLSMMPHRVIHQCATLPQGG